VRVTNAMMMNQALHDLSGLRDNYAKAQAAVNGRSLQRPSEDPQRVVEAMDLSGTKLRLERSKRSGEDASEWLSVTETHITAMIEQLQGAKDAAVQAGSPGSLDATGREALAATCDAINGSLMQEMNSQYRDQYLFAGTKTNLQPFQATNGVAVYQPPINSANPKDGQLNRDVAPGLSVTVNVAGNQLFGGGNFTQTLTDMAAALRSGDTGTVLNQKLQELQDELSHLTTVRSQLGVRQNQIEQFQNYAQDTLVTIEQRMTDITGTDITTAVLQMTQAQNAYQAALSSFAKALPTSLLDYMK
jgi:flagellar hook-associated protein 3 FlgL